MKHFGRIPCPEDEDEIKEKENTSKSSKKITFSFFSGKHGKNIVWNEKQKQILNTGTRLALLSVIGLSSAFIYQFLWILSVRLDVLGVFSYTWGIDTCINIICIYLSFQFPETNKLYNIICTKCCLCHGCCLKCVGAMARNRTR